MFSSFLKINLKNSIGAIKQPRRFKKHVNPLILSIKYPGNVHKLLFEICKYISEHYF